MRLSFNVSKYTIIFSLYVIISASFMYHLLNFIRFDLWIPRKITYENFEENILKKLNEILKEKHIMRAFICDEITNYLANNGFKILAFYANSLMKPYNDKSNKIIIHFEKKR